MTHGPRATLHFKLPGMPAGWTACGIHGLTSLPSHVRRLYLRSLLRHVTCKSCRRTVVYKHVQQQAKLASREVHAEATRRRADADRETGEAVG